MLATVKARMLTGLMGAAAAATIGLPPVVQAQTAGSHLSLADRVSRLEQQQGQGGIGLVNEVQQLRDQVQQLQGQIEELQHQLQQLQQASQDRYVDLDSRLARLEGTAPAASDTGLPAVAGSTDLGDVELGNSGSAAAPAVPDAGVASASGDPQAEYDHAFSALRNGNFASASRLFQAFIASHPNNELTPNAYYWLGESYYGTQNYQVALQTFQQLLKRFPDDAKAPGALLKVGYSQFELKQWDQARATLEQVRQRYPDSREALLAAGRLRALGLQTAN